MATPQDIYRLVKFQIADCSCCWDEVEIEQTSDYAKVQEWLDSDLESSNRRVQQLHTWVSLNWQSAPDSPPPPPPPHVRWLSEL